jgi:hypothetical protein
VQVALYNVGRRSESDAIFARALDAAEGKYHRVHHDIGRIALADGKLDVAEKELRAYCAPVTRVRLPATSPLVCPAVLSTRLPLHASVCLPRLSPAAASPPVCCVVSARARACARAAHLPPPPPTLLPSFDLTVTVVLRGSPHDACAFAGKSLELNPFDRIRFDTIQSALATVAKQRAAVLATAPKARRVNRYAPPA